MTQRDANEDLNISKLGEGFIHQEVLPYWINKAQKLQKTLYILDDSYKKVSTEWQNENFRAEAAEQERDKLIDDIRKVQQILLKDRRSSEHILEIMSAIAEMLDIVLEGSKADAPSEREYKVKRYLLTHPNHDPFQLRVINDINLPNNPEFDELIEEWLFNNYGNLDGWEYYCLSRTKMRTIGADTDATE